MRAGNTRGKHSDTGDKTSQLSKDGEVSSQQKKLRCTQEKDGKKTKTGRGK